MITKALAALVLVGAALQAPAHTVAFEITRVPSGVIPPGLETRGGTRVLGLNDLGQYVGMFGERNGTIWGVPHAFIHGSQGWGTQPGFPPAWEPGGFRLGPILGELYPDPAYRYLDLFPAAWPSAFNERVNQPLAINNAGVVVGRIGSDYLDNGPFQAYRYDSPSGQLQVLAIPGATSAEAVDINDHGDIVGHFTDATGTRGFLWRDGQVTVIELPGTSGRTQLSGINNLGSIVGRTLDAGENRSFIFSDGSFEMFSVDGLYTTAHDINDLGQIVGSVGISGQRRGFLYESGQSVLLDLSDSGQSTYAYTINNLGVIGGAIEGASGGGFLATVTPIPEPATALLWLSAALLAAWRGTGRWSVRAFRLRTSQNGGRGADDGRRRSCEATSPAAAPKVAMPSRTARTMDPNRFTMNSNTWKRSGWVAMALVLAMLAGGCGGSRNKAPAYSQNIDVSVPESGARKVTALFTPSGVIAVADTIPTTSTDNEEGYLILGGDSSEDIYLAAYVAPGSAIPRLSVQSTAVALAVMAQGRLPDGLSQPDFTRSVQQAAAFPGLVEAVRGTLERATAPGQDGVVWQRLGVLLNEVVPGGAAAGAGSFARPLALGRPSATFPLPFTLVRGGPGSLELALLRSVSSVSGVEVINGIPTHFALRGARVDDDSSIGELPVHLGREQVLISESTFFSLGEVYTSATVPGNGDTWNLHIFKSDYAKQKDFEALTEDILSVILKGFTSSACIQQAAVLLVSLRKQDWDVDGALAATVDRWVESLSDLSTWTSIGESLPDCGLRSGLLPERGQRVARLLSLALKAPNALVNGVNAASRVAYLALYWSLDTRVGICQVVDDSSGALSLIACVAELQSFLLSAQMQVGQQQPFDMAAFDESGRPASVPAPGRFRFSSSDPGVVSIDANGIITALGASAQPVIIRAELPGLGLEVSVAITVTAAPELTVEIDATPTTVVVGDPVTVRWNSSNAEACSASGNWSGPAALSGTTTFVPPTPGTYVLRLDCVNATAARGGEVVVQVLELPASEGLEIRVNGSLRSFTATSDSVGPVCAAFTDPSPCLFMATFFDQSGTDPGPKFVRITLANYSSVRVLVDFRDDTVPGGAVIASVSCSDEDERLRGCTAQSLGIRVDPGQRKVYFSNTPLRGVLLIPGQPEAVVVLNGSLSY